MNDYAEKILKEVMEKSDFSESNASEEYVYVREYLEKLGDNLTQEYEGCYREMIESLVGFVNGSKYAKKVPLTLDFLGKKLKNIEVKIKEESEKLSYFRIFDPPELVSAKNKKLEIEQEIKSTEPTKNEFIELRDRSISNLNIFKKNLNEFQKEAEDYFNIELKSLVLFGGIFDDKSEEFLGIKNFIISNYIKMRFDGYKIHDASVFDNEHKINIVSKISELIDRNAKKASEIYLEEEFLKMKERYKAVSPNPFMDDEFCEFIKNKIKSGIEIDVYRKMKKQNYNPRFCQRRIDEIGVSSSIDRIESQIDLYITLQEKLEKINRSFIEKNSQQDVLGQQYESPFKLMSFDQKFNEIIKILGNSKEKNIFDKNCTDILLSNVSLENYEAKYLSKKPGKLESNIAYIRSWTEWIPSYSRQLNAVRAIFGDKLIDFIVNKFIVPYPTFWKNFYSSTIQPWLDISYNFFRKEDPFFIKATKVLAISLSILFSTVALISVSAFMPPLILLGAWIVPRAGIFARSGIQALYERYEINRYGYRDHIHFSCRGELKNLVDNKEHGKELQDMNIFSKRIGKLIDDCNKNIEIIKKEIDKNPESKEKNLAWMGAPILFKMPKWLTRFLPSPEVLGGKISSATEMVLGVSKELAETKDNLNKLRESLKSLEKKKEILNNAWDKIINREANESDLDYAQRVIETTKEIDEYIKYSQINDYNKKIIETGLNASGIGSFHEGFKGLHKIKTEMEPEQHSQKHVTDKNVKRINTMLFNKQQPPVEQKRPIEQNQPPALDQNLANQNVTEKITARRNVKKTKQ